MDMLIENGSKVHSIYDHDFGIPRKFKFLISSCMISYYGMSSLVQYDVLWLYKFLPQK